MSRSFVDEVKYQRKYGGMHIKLIGINIAVFLFINILLSLGSLMVPPGGSNPAEAFVSYVFTLKGSPYGLLTRPWGLVTSIFAHFGFLHFLFNMVFLYFISRFFLTYFSNQRLLYTYVLGGIAGGLLQVTAHSIFPALQGINPYILGASGAVNAVFMATAFYRPMAEVYLFGLLKVKIIYLALIFFFMDLFQMGASDNIAHFAHIGGALFGILSIRNLASDNNVINYFQRNIKVLKSKLKKKSKLKVHRNKNQPKYTTASRQTDEEYNYQKKKRQEEIDLILEKISKSGYDSLTKREKQILFDQSKR